jgi:hypothetical protein
MQCGNTVSRAADTDVRFREMAPSHGWATLATAGLLARVSLLAPDLPGCPVVMRDGRGPCADRDHPGAFAPRLQLRGQPRNLPPRRGHRVPSCLPRRGTVTGALCSRVRPALAMPPGSPLARGGPAPEGRPDAGRERSALARGGPRQEQVTAPGRDPVPGRGRLQCRSLSHGSLRHAPPSRRVRPRLRDPSRPSTSSASAGWFSAAALVLLLAVAAVLAPGCSGVAFSSDSGAGPATASGRCSR